MIITSTEAARHAADEAAVIEAAAVLRKLDAEQRIELYRPAVANRQKALDEARGRLAGLGDPFPAELAEAEAAVSTAERHLADRAAKLENAERDLAELDAPVVLEDIERESGLSRADFEAAVGRLHGAGVVGVQAPRLTPRPRGYNIGWTPSATHLVACQPLDVDAEVLQALGDLTVAEGPVLTVARLEAVASRALGRVPFSAVVHRLACARKLTLYPIGVMSTDPEDMRITVEDVDDHGRPVPDLRCSHVSLYLTIEQYLAARVAELSDEERYSFEALAAAPTAATA